MKGERIAMYVVDSSRSASEVKSLFFSSNEGDSEKDVKVWNAFRSGSREALDYIFKLHAPNLFAYGTKFTKDRNLVLDCIQDQFVELWNRRENLGETNSIKYYLLCAIRRRILRAIQGVQRYESIQEEAHYFEEKFSFSHEHLLVVQETDHLRKISLKKAVATLTKRQREVIYLKFQQGLDNEAISSVMGLTLGSVNTLVSQAVRDIRSSIS